MQLSPARLGPPSPPSLGSGSECLLVSKPSPLSVQCYSLLSTLCHPKPTSTPTCHLEWSSFSLFYTHKHTHVRALICTCTHTKYEAYLIAQLVKNLPAVQETLVQFLGQEDPLEKGKATHSSILAWRSPWTVESMGSQRVRHS